MAAAAARFESGIALLKIKRLEAPASTAAYAVPENRYNTYFGWALGYLASAAASQRGLAATLDVVVEGVEELRASGDEVALGMAEVGLGNAYAFRAELDKARSTLDEPLAIGRRHANRFLITFATQILGDVARIQGDFTSSSPLPGEPFVLA